MSRKQPMLFDHGEEKAKVADRITGTATPQHGTVVYNRGRWVRAASKIVTDHQRVPVSRDIEFLYTGCLTHSIKLGYDVQDYLRKALNFLEQVAQDIFPTDTDVVDFTGKPRLQRRAEGKSKRERAIELSEVVRAIAPPPRVEPGNYEAKKMTMEGVTGSDNAALTQLPLAGLQE